VWLRSKKQIALAGFVGEKIRSENEREKKVKVGNERNERKKALNCKIIRNEN